MNTIQSQSNRPLPPFEGYLSIQEDGRWTKHWCTLEDGTLQLYCDRYVVAVRWISIDHN